MIEACNVMFRSHGTVPELQSAVLHGPNQDLIGMLVVAHELGLDQNVRQIVIGKRYIKNTSQLFVPLHDRTYHLQDVHQ